MKKILFASLMVWIVSLFIFEIQCKDMFIKIKSVSLNQIETTQNYKTPQKETKKDIKESNKKENKNVYVNILLKNDNSSIFHNEIKVTGNKLSIYYGKNFRNKIENNSLKIMPNSDFFKKNNIVKIESTKDIKWIGHNEKNNSNKYNGILYIYKQKNNLIVVNKVNLEEYVAKVLSSEIGTDAPLEALKAQAVCARTYILKQRKDKYKKYNAVADDSTDYQVYNRIEPNENCKKAAYDTKNKVLKEHGKLINAYYFSTTCGFTTDYKIWGKEKKDYLQSANLLHKKTSENITDNDNFKKFIKSKPDGYEKDYPYYRWNCTFTNEQIKNGIYNTFKENIGNIKSIEVNKRGQGGIVSELVVNGSLKQIILKKQSEIRKVFASPCVMLYLNAGNKISGISMLPSAFFHIEKISEGYKLYGGGFGHGSGLSQNGAIAMAKQNMKYEDILKKFYKNVELVKY